MKNFITQTDNSWTPAILRVTLGAVVLAHGAQKLFGWFGGYGFTGTMSYFTDTVGLPWLVGLLIIFLEVFGSIAIIIGLGTRLFAVSFTGLASGIMFSQHIQHGFFMNWYGNQSGEGFEYFLLWIAISTSLLIAGGGKYSLDRLIFIKESLK